MLEFIGYESTWTWWASAYFVIGMILGGLSAIFTFGGLWFWSANEKRFWGFLLGWFPSAIAAGIVGFLMIFVWGILALIALFWSR